MIKDFGMKQFNMVDSNLEKSTDLKILSVNSNYISMLIVTNKSYVYAEKYYKDAQLQSCLTFEIFKKQNLANIDYNFIKYLIFSNLVENHGFDELEFSKSLKKNKIYFHKWFEMDGITHT